MRFARSSRTTGLSEQALALLRLMGHLEQIGEFITTAKLAALRGTRTGPTTRMLQKLRSRGYVELVKDVASDKGAREWKLKKTPTG